MPTYDQIWTWSADGDLDEGGDGESQCIGQDESEEAGVEVPERLAHAQSNESNDAGGDDECAYGEEPGGYAFMLGVGVLDAGVCEGELATEAVCRVDDGEETSEEQGCDPVDCVGCDDAEAWP